MKFLINGTNSQVPDTGATSYMHVAHTWNWSNDASELKMRCICPTEFTLTNFRIKLGAAPGVGKSYTYTIMKNGVATGLSIIVADSNKTGYSSGVVNYTTGDSIAISIVPTNTPGSPTGTPFTGTQWCIEGNTTSTENQPIFSRLGTSVISGTVYWSAPFNGGGGTSSTDNVSTIVTAGTISDLWVITSSAPGVDVTYTLQKNGVDTAVQFFVTSGSTVGRDNTHSVAVVDGDTLSLKVVASGSAVGVSVMTSIKFTPTNPGQNIYNFNSVAALNNTPPVHLDPVGGSATASTSPDDKDALLMGNVIISKMTISYGALGGATGSQSWSLTKNNLATAYNAVLSNTSTTASFTTPLQYLPGDTLGLQVSSTTFASGVAFIQGSYVFKVVESNNFLPFFAG